jgi:hypothetical protein
MAQRGLEMQSEQKERAELEAERKKGDWHLFYAQKRMSRTKINCAIIHVLSCMAG